MYEETKSSIDWKGLILKVIIVFLVVLIGIKGYSIFKSKNKTTLNDQNSIKEVTDSKNNSNFTSNMEKLRTSGKNYFEKNKGKIPKTEKTTIMVTLNELISEGYITELIDENGNKCDKESSYVTATLDEKNIKVKANLVCGSASTYSTVYLNNNASTTEEKKETNSTSTSTNISTNSNNNSSSSITTNKTDSSSTTTNKTNTTTCTTNCTPKVEVNVDVSQTTTINGNTTSNNENTNNKPELKKYTVKFDSNGGDITYKDEIVIENEKVKNPGMNKKFNCSFKGWYYNGTKYDFSTPVTKNMTLIANYTCEKNIVTKTLPTTVYTSGWDKKDTQNIIISHVLKLPEDIKQENPIKVKISNISYKKALNTREDISNYIANFEKTFIYEENGWEATAFTPKSLSTINSNVGFKFDYGYKTLENALNGFNVTWVVNSVAKQCEKTFSVNNVSNLCGYGIVYEVTWEYQIYE